MSDWINAERASPDTGGEYIVYEKLNNRVSHDYWNAPDAEEPYFKPFWNHYGNYVSAWQPLPPPPEDS